MGQYELSASQWQQIEGFLPGRPGHVGVTARDNRSFVNGVLWVLRSGAQWRTCPGNTATGRASTSVSPAGPSPVSGRGYSKSC